MDQARAGTHARMPRRVARRGLIGAVMAIAAICMVAPPAHARDDEQDKVLRVCQDPNNMPLSNRDGAGLENRIAQLFAEKLGWKLEHTWYPQRMGFVRNTLKAKLPDSDRYKCDLVTGVAAGFDLGMTTRPYYRSTYAMAYVKGRGLDEVHAPGDLLKLDPARLRTLRIGAFIRTPAVDWLLQHGLIEQMVSYQHQSGDPERYTGEVVDHDLADGKLDVVIAWGPIVGYFARHAKPEAPMAVVPFAPDASGLRYDFDIAMAVRHGDKDLRDRIDRLIDSSRPEIAALLQEYGVPAVPCSCSNAD